jgi:hypothetical protein
MELCATSVAREEHPHASHFGVENATNLSSA